MKQQFKIYPLKKKKVSEGDRVSLIDGSSLTSKEYPNKQYYIVFAYEHTGYKLLKDSKATVVQTNIENTFCNGASNSLYQQDILIKIGNGHFYTSSAHISIIEDGNK